MAQRKPQWPETLDYVTAYGAYAQHETQRGFLHVSENIFLDARFYKPENRQHLNRQLSKQADKAVLEGKNNLVWQLRKCVNVKHIHSTRTTCPVCGGPVRIPHPAKFSPDDKYFKYRMAMKRRSRTMKETYIKEFAQITPAPNNPVLIEGLPGLGLVGKIALRYLIKAVESQKNRLPLQPTLPLLRSS